jgi:hypothetical protein
MLRTASAGNLDRDVSTLGILVRHGVVVEPDPALTQVPEVQCATGRDGHGRAAGAAAAYTRALEEAVSLTWLK